MNFKRLPTFIDSNLRSFVIMQTRMLREKQIQNPNFSHVMLKFIRILEDLEISDGLLRILKFKTESAVGGIDLSVQYTC